MKLFPIELPKEIQNIIMIYKKDLENYENYKKSLSIIKNININYHISMNFPLFPYIIKVMKIDKKTKINILCECCCNNILDTYIHYNDFDFLDHEEVLNYLFYVEGQLIMDYWKGRTLKCSIDKFSSKKYNNIINIINRD